MLYAVAGDSGRTHARGNTVGAGCAKASTLRPRSFSPLKFQLCKARSARAANTGVNAWAYSTVTWLSSR